MGDPPPGPAPQRSNSSYRIGTQSGDQTIARMADYHRLQQELQLQHEELATAKREARWQLSQRKKAEAALAEGDWLRNKATVRKAMDEKQREVDRLLGFMASLQTDLQAVERKVVEQQLTLNDAQIEATNACDARGRAEGAHQGETDRGFRGLT